jgi:hypothetical protein
MRANAPIIGREPGFDSAESWTSQCQVGGIFGAEIHIDPKRPGRANAQSAIGGPSGCRLQLSDAGSNWQRRAVRGISLERIAAGCGNDYRCGTHDIGVTANLNGWITSITGYVHGSLGLSAQLSGNYGSVGFAGGGGGLSICASLCLPIRAGLHLSVAARGRFHARFVRGCVSGSESGVDKWTGSELHRVPLVCGRRPRSQALEPSVGSRCAD